MATAKPKPPIEAYRPPQKLLVPCACCGMTVLRGQYAMGANTYHKEAQLRDPFSGDPHDCNVALAQWWRVMRQRWQDLWIFGPHWDVWHAGKKAETPTPLAAETARGAALLIGSGTDPLNTRSIAEGDNR